MTAIQVVGAVIALAGVVWVFIHPSAKGEGEASYAGFSVKSLTQGGLVILVGAALLYFGKKEEDHELTLGEWATQANRACEEGFAEISALQIPADPVAQFEALPQTTQISTRINSQIQAIGRPEGFEARVDGLLSTASQSNVDARTSYNYWRNGEQAPAQGAFTQARQLEEQVETIDGELGANVCALGP